MLVKVETRSINRNNHGEEALRPRLPRHQWLYKVVLLLAVCSWLNDPADIAGERLHSVIAITLGLPMVGGSM
jgi:hypothetical protein